MKIYSDIKLKDFYAWSGAEKTLNTIIEHGDDELVEQYLMDFFEGEYLNETEVNDMLRFEHDEIASWLGYESWEQYENSTNED